MAYNGTYIPADEVQGFHQLPHLNAQLQRRSGDFGITADSQWNSYTQSLYPLPIICVGIALTAVVMFQLGFSLYYFWRHKSAVPYVHDRRVPTDPLRNCRIAFVLMLVTITVFAQFIPVGNSYLTSGVSNSNNRLDYLDNTFTSLNTDGSTLNIEGTQLQLDFNSSYEINNCAAAQQLDDALPAYFASVNEYLSNIEDVPDKAKDFQDALNLYAVRYKNNAVWMFYGWLTVCPGIYFIGMFFNSRRTVYGAVGLAELIMCFVYLVCLAGMIILMGVADFCMEPTANLLQITPESLYNTTQYYTSCIGGNPLQPSLSAAEQLIQQTATGVQAALDTTCPGDTYLLDSQQVIGAIQATFAQIESTMSCPPIQNSLMGLLNDSFCTETFSGLYTMWYALFVCGAGLWGMTVACAVGTLFFPRDSDDAKIEALHVPYQAEGREHESYTPHGATPHEVYGDAPDVDGEDPGIILAKTSTDKLNPVHAQSQSRLSTPSQRATPGYSIQRTNSSENQSSKGASGIIWV